VADAGDGDREVSLGWLREPPRVNEVRVFLECGEDVELSDEARRALEQLLNELNDAEVSGYAVPRPEATGPSMNIFSFSFDVQGLACGKRKRP
jgi:hypothetical protein